jgi:ribonuclease E
MLPAWSLASARSAPPATRSPVSGVRPGLEAKKQRRREGREAGVAVRSSPRPSSSPAARASSGSWSCAAKEGRTQIGVLEDNVLVEHYVSRETNASMAGNIYLGKVQNVLPSMEAAFVDIGRGRNAVLYAGEVNWDAAGLEAGSAKRIENALESGQSVLVQVTKDPIGHKGARLTSQISLPGRYLVYVPEGSMTGISRKLPDTERPGSSGSCVTSCPRRWRHRAHGCRGRSARRSSAPTSSGLAKIWERIKAKAAAPLARRARATRPTLLYGEPDLTVRVIRDVFNEDFTSLVVSGDDVWTEISDYVEDVAPDLAPRMTKWTGEQDIFTAHRIDEQLAKAWTARCGCPRVARWSSTAPRR